MDNAVFSPGLRLLCCRLTRLGGANWGGLGSMSAPYWRLYWNRAPGATVSLESREQPLTPEMLLLIPPNTPYRGRVVQGVDHLYLHFTLQAPFLKVEPDLFVCPGTPETLELARQIAATIERAGDGAMRASVLATALIYMAMTHVPEDRLRPGCVDERFQAVMNHMEENLDRRVANSALAEMARMNTNAFIRRFRNVTGETPQNFLRTKRVERACMLLHYSAQSIEQIAAATGFCDRYHFSRAFRKLRGMGPATFRRMMEG
ncbi:MAG: hypothetical protein A3K19_24325 [Lentisphaerae bacterium RIFOXYB12_FULL_65_16]|nr:MAG: hypothetical protein A3K18_21895 [Lentisphaerae bacterium RIFOXYA12_64_32]OGV93464.1 MAG: hypothetical protein A3K19_24325 [Lentisphaerae bacterium RIFOXYB12_FULL_65_16]